MAFVVVSVMGNCDFSHHLAPSEREPEPEVQAEPLTGLQRETWSKLEKGEPFGEVGAHLGTPTGISEQGELITYYYEASRGGFVDTRPDETGERVVVTFQAPFESEAEMAETEARKARQAAQAEKNREKTHPLLVWREGFKAVKPGMTGAEVEKIVGKPTYGRKSVNPDPSWVYALKSPSARTVIHLKGRQMAEPAELKVVKVDIFELTPKLLKHIENDRPIYERTTY